MSFTESSPSLSVFALGGTIAMGAVRDSGVAPSLTGEDLVSAVPELADLADFKVHQFRQVPSADLTIMDLVELAATIRADASSGTDGAVVTVGTDTLAEVAYGLSALLSKEHPVVVTGAMRHPAQAGADGPGNLLAAVRTCITLAVEGPDVVVVMNDEIHDPMFVRKLNTASTSAFGSPTAGVLGRITEGRPRLLMRPALVTDAVVPDPATVASSRVGYLAVVMSTEASDLEVAASDVDGLVVEGFGGGHVPGRLADRLGKVARRVPVVLASRPGSGRVLTSTYGFTGSETDLQQRGVISAGWLDGPKAHTLLSLALGAGEDRAAIADRFAELQV